MIACCRPLAAPSLSDAEIETTAQLFKTLGDPTRVRIVHLLATSEEPVCVCELVEPLGLTQPTVSHHLKVLADAGLVTRERRGTWMFYRLVPERVEALRDALSLPAEKPRARRSA
jgi:ArsR family transcriptional regulator, arsenate/arsenite/antimonite-responsive transcriptional repressor